MEDERGDAAKLERGSEVKNMREILPLLERAIRLLKDEDRGAAGATSDTESLLLADHAHFGESLWRNEEVGEKRISFFISLVTAVMAGLVALHTAERPPLNVEMVTKGAIWGLLVLGVMTYLRLLQRNRVGDQYQRTLEYIRWRLAEHGAMSDYMVPQPLNGGLWKYFRGGLAETTGALNAFLLYVALRSREGGLLDPQALVAGLVLLVVSWAVAAPRRGVQ